MTLVQESLFPEPEVEREQNPRPPDWNAMIARRKLQQTEAWQVHTWKRVGPDAVQITGGIPIGKRKDGSPKWGPRSTDLTCVVVFTEVEAERLRYEREEGKCADCVGCGRESAGWSQATGTIWKDCRRCTATGKPPAPTTQEG